MAALVPGPRPVADLVAAPAGPPEHLTTLGGCGLSFEAIEIPAHQQAVASFSGVDLVGHRPVVVRQEPVGHRPQLDDVEPRVPRDEGIEGPSHERDARIQRLSALRELERVADAAILCSGQGRELVRMHVETVVDAHTGPPQYVTDQRVVAERPVRDVSRFRQRDHHLAGHRFVLAPRRAHHPGDPIGVLG